MKRLVQKANYGQSLYKNVLKIARKSAVFAARAFSFNVVVVYSARITGRLVIEYDTPMEET